MTNINLSYMLVRVVLLLNLLVSVSFSQPIDSKGETQFLPSAEEILFSFDSYEDDNINVFLNTYTLRDGYYHGPGSEDSDTLSRLEIMVKKYDSNRILSNILYQELIFNLSSVDRPPKSECGWFGCGSNKVEYVDIEPIKISNKVYDYKDHQLVNVRILYYQLVHFGIQVGFYGSKFVVVVNHMEDEIFLANEMSSESEEHPGWSRVIEDHESWIITILSMVFLAMAAGTMYVLVLFNNLLTNRASRHKGRNWTDDEKQRLIREFFKR